MSGSNDRPAAAGHPQVAVRPVKNDTHIQPDSRPSAVDDDRRPSGLVPDRLYDATDPAFSLKSLATALEPERCDAGRGSAFVAVLRLDDAIARWVLRRMGAAAGTA